MRCLPRFEAAVFVLLVSACSSFGEEREVTPDPPESTRKLRYRIEPSLVVLEAGKHANATLVIEELPAMPIDAFDVTISGLPEGITQVAPTRVTTETTKWVLRLEAEKGTEGLAFPVKVASRDFETSFDVRTITKTAPVLDETYGSAGRAFTGGGHWRDVARGVVVQPDGKVIVAGGYNTGYTRVPALARYDVNGALDPTFGDGGIALIDDHTNSLAVGIALQSDGKILVLEAFDFSVTRLTSAGKIDAEFGLGGLTFAQWNVENAATAIIVQADGKIVVGGRASGTGDDFGVVRYLTTGALDTTWNGTGRATTSVVNGDDAVTALAIDGSGAIFAAGTANVAGRTHVGLARFDANGASTGTTTYSSNASADDVAAAIAVAGASVFVAGTHREGALADRGFVARFGSDLAFGAAFDAGEVAASALAVQPNGMLLLGGVRAGHAALARLARDGSLDGTFGTGGSLTTTLGDASAVRALALTADGRVVAAGAKRVATDFDVTVVRYAESGALDTTWGTAGIVAMPFGPGDDGIRTAVLAPDGKLVVAGYAYNGMDFDILVARLLPDGKLDPSFGNGTGRVIYDRPGTSQFAYGIVVQPDGKIVVSGQGGPGTVVLRLNADGALDALFGTQGVTVISEGDAFGVALRPDGKLTVAGAAPARGFFASRLTPSGAVDATFGQNGIVTTQFDADARGIAFALDPNGKLVVAGHVDFKTPPNFFDLAVARFDENGALDKTFDGDGKTTLNTSDVELFYTTALQSDGKVLVAGRASKANEASSFAVFRLDASGALDTSFGVGGRANVDLGPGSQASSLVVQPNGAILVSGRGREGGAVTALLSARGEPAWPGGSLTTLLDGEAFAVVRDQGARIIVAGYERRGVHEDGVVLRYRR